MSYIYAPKLIFVVFQKGDVHINFTIPISAHHQTLLSHQVSHVDLF